MKVSAKCMNHSGCLRAYRGETIELDPGAPLVCPECGKPLVKVGGGAQGAIKAAAILVVVLVIIVAGALGYKMMKKKNAAAGEASSTPTPELSSTAQSSSSTTTAPSTTASSVPATTPQPSAPAAPATNEPPPAAPVPTDEAVTPQVRQEVLTRIDKMPNLTPEKKDRLYNSVQRARDMRKLVEISFSSGQTQMPTTSAPQVKKLLEDPAVMKFRDDLTAVFVVLGFADSKGNEKANYDISEKRAKAVVEYMEKQCGVKNVTHAVGMGGTNLVDKNNAAKNRIAEIWAVLP